MKTIAAIVALAMLAGCATTGGTGPTTRPSSLDPVIVRALAEMAITDAVMLSGADPAPLQHALAVFDAAPAGTPTWLAALQAVNAAVLDLAAKNHKAVAPK